MCLQHRVLTNIEAVGRGGAVAHGPGHKAPFGRWKMSLGLGKGERVSSEGNLEAEAEPST